MRGTTTFPNRLSNEVEGELVCGYDHKLKPGDQARDDASSNAKPVSRIARYFGQDTYLARLTLPDGDENTWLGAFGESWFKTMCCAAACPCGKVEPDTVGSDYFVHNHDSEIIRVQVKATQRPDFNSNGYSFALDVQTYNRLRAGNAPGYLVLVVVHEPHPRWTGHCHRGSIVRATGYWVRIAGMPMTDNSSTVTLSLPLGNMVTPESLPSLFPPFEGGDQ